MSSISDDAKVQIFLADYAAADASNKVNALGVGFQICIPQATGLTSPLTVVVLVDVPAVHAGEECAVELTLVNDSGEVVGVPGPTGENTALRFGQNTPIQQPGFNLPGLRVPRDAVWARHQLVANFQTGLPLPVSQSYRWRVSIDGNTRKDWEVSFYVPGPSGGVVVG
jgi:hypothetical protein